MANADGGIIVTGVEEHKAQTSDDSHAAGVRPFQPGQWNTEDLHKAVAALVHPHPAGLEIKRFDVEGGCVGGVWIPRQDDEVKPYLTLKLPVQGGSTQGFGIPRRRGTYTTWDNGSDIYRDIIDARAYRRIMSQVDGDPSRWPAFLRNSFVVARGDQVTIAERLHDRLDEIEQRMDWDDRSIYALAVRPVVPASQMPGMYDDLRHAFEQAESLRPLGFGIGYPEESSAEEGSLRATDGFRYREVWEDGLFVVATPGSARFLCRQSREREVPGPLTISPVVLVEFTYEFFRFAHRHLLSRVGGDWEATVVLRRAKSSSWPLMLGKNSTFDDPQPANKDELVHTFGTSTSAQRDALQVLQQVYGRFSLGGPVPFTDAHGVDEAQLLALG